MLQAKPYLQGIILKREEIKEPDSYPFNIPALRNFDSLAFHPDVTFFIGENATGKSTLVEAIAVAMGFNAEGGTKGSTFSTQDTHSLLHRYLKLMRSYKRPTDGYFLRAESFYNLATLMDDIKDPGYLIPYGGKSLHHQSHGESFMAALANKLRGNGFYVFDEPEAALSPKKQFAALAVIHDLVKNGSQFIIAAHSPILMSYPKATIYEFSDDGISKLKYEETAHYSLTKYFLNNYEEMLKRIFEE